ncbi:hypothetical protein Lal_00041580 [Lupinus albus]|uniref:Putative SKP1/BTB/POZ domain, NPH3 domain-containing protein n=1 Tax=Lupinus albus TaxID=3870 RepID=A0A6A4P743_LUPAL|nr:putative SKP1/BTB/POZ domain, NPH3 domain-containing protein [Lupinus albus]KAF1874135.1 hypothetical protein Lal_00041580 [Lupinus albus]
MKRSNEWIHSEEIPSDIIVQVGEASFSLHKFPLVSKCGYIRKLLSESSGANVSFIELHDVPGGAKAFELSAKFCYGVNFEISIENIAILRCVAEYLEMTEEHSGGNLVGRTDSYLNEVALKTISGAVSILHMSENFLPIAEKAKLMSRCIDTIAYIACKESQFFCSSSRNDSHADERLVAEWWAEDLIVLRIDIFQRVLVAIMARGFKHYAVGPILMLYSHKFLGGLDIDGKGRKKLAPQDYEKGVVLETLVSLLPREKKAMPVSFLSMLLRGAIYLETTVACRIDLEKRMAMQLEQAVLDDLLIPSYAFTGDTSFHVDTVQRIIVSYLESEMGNHSVYSEDDEYFSPPHRNVNRIGKLMENYIAEIAIDQNLPVVKFISLAELIPKQSRPTDDGMYRAIDIYLKAHPILSDLERKKVCNVMDCKKLSREACAHAAKNNRLPLQTVIQVLYCEQQGFDSSSNAMMNVYSTTELNPFSHELSSLRSENEELQQELVKLKLKLKEIEETTLRSACSSPLVNASASYNKPPLSRKSFISSVSKKLWHLSLLHRADPVTTPFEDGIKPDKNRRHSIS